MFLRRILVSDFKNIGEAQLEFSRKINCISGNNGEGKTNLLDAIYYLSMTKSFFSSTDAYTFTFGKDAAAVNGTYVLDDNTEDSISIGLKREGEKTVKKNAKVYKRIAEHIGRYPIVMVSPADTILVNGSGEERRKFLTLILSQIDKEYLKRMQSYNQLLLQRNKLLKMQNLSGDLLETMDFQMSVHADYIYRKRDELCKKLIDSVRVYYQALSGSKEEIGLKYISDLQEDSLDKLLESNRERDCFLKFTSVGIHKDDIDFTLNGMPLKKCGSQGQQKSFLVALKLAQFEIMKNLHGTAPILLLDDVFDKLDMQRVEYLLQLVASDAFGQIFISDSNKVRMASIVERFTSECSSFEVTGGVYTKL
jgi:DNA replication and repair protein RecF